LTNILWIHCICRINEYRHVYRTAKCLKEVCVASVVINPLLDVFDTNKVCSSLMSDNIPPWLYYDTHKKSVRISNYRHVLATFS